MPLIRKLAGRSSTGADGLRGSVDVAAADVDEGQVALRAGQIAERPVGVLRGVEAKALHGQLCLGGEVRVAVTEEGRGFHGVVPLLLQRVGEEAAELI